MFESNFAVRNLSEAALRNKLTPAYGREAEVAELLGVLSSGDGKSALIVGPPGIGKKWFVAAVALAAAQDEDGGPQFLELLAPALRSETVRVHEAVTELLAAFTEGDALILFIDDAFSVLTAEDDDRRVAGRLGPAIRRGDVRCIGAVTEAEYERLKEEAPSVAGLLEVVHLKPLSPEKTLRLLERFRPALEAQYGVRVDEKALPRAIRLAEEYLPDEPLPGKAVRVLRAACKRCKRRIQALTESGETMDSSLEHLGDMVVAEDVRRAIDAMTPTDVLAAEEATWEDRLLQRLKRDVFGQDHALAQIATTMAAVRKLFGQPACAARAMLFAGPPAVGKRRTACVLAQKLVGRYDNAIVFDMTRYATADAASRIFGSGPGQGSNLDARALAAAVRSLPLTLCVFDGVEQAHPAALEALVRVVGANSLTELGAPEGLSKRCLFVLTLNCAAPPSDAGRMPQWIQGVVLKQVPEEVVRRCQTVVPFRPLDSAAQRTILGYYLAGLRARLKRQDVDLRVDDSVYSALIAREARNAAALSQNLARHILHPVTGLIDGGGLRSGDTVTVALHDGEVTVRQESSPAAPPGSEA